MDLLLVRHGVAEDRETFATTGKDDSERPLTDAGRRKFRRGARGLKRLVESIALLVTSPLVRAVQTGQILQEVYGIGKVAHLPQLAPDAAPESLDGWLDEQRELSVVAVVGHEPHLSRMAAHLLTGGAGVFLELKKGGACLISFGERPAPGHGVLCWLLTGSQLRTQGA